MPMRDSERLKRLLNEPSQPADEVDNPYRPPWVRPLPQKKAPSKEKSKPTMKSYQFLEDSKKYVKRLETLQRLDIDFPGLKVAKQAEYEHNVEATRQGEIRRLVSLVEKKEEDELRRLEMTRRSRKTSIINRGRSSTIVDEPFRPNKVFSWQVSGGRASKFRGPGNMTVDPIESSSEEEELVEEIQEEPMSTRRIRWMTNMVGAAKLEESTLPENEKSFGEFLLKKRFHYEFPFECPVDDIGEALQYIKKVGPASTSKRIEAVATARPATYGGSLSDSEDSGERKRVSNNSFKDQYGRDEKSKKICRDYVVAPDGCRRPKCQYTHDDALKSRRPPLSHSLPLQDTNMYAVHYVDFYCVVCHNFIVDSREIHQIFKNKVFCKRATGVYLDWGTRLWKEDGTGSVNAHCKECNNLLGTYMDGSKYFKMCFIWYGEKNRQSLYYWRSPYAPLLETVNGQVPKQSIPEQISDNSGFQARNGGHPFNWPEITMDRFLPAEARQQTSAVNVEIANDQARLARGVQNRTKLNDRDLHFLIRVGASGRSLEERKEIFESVKDALYYDPELHKGSDAVHDRKKIFDNTLREILDHHQDVILLNLDTPDSILLEYMARRELKQLKKQSPLVQVDLWKGENMQQKIQIPLPIMHDVSTIFEAQTKGYHEQQDAYAKTSERRRTFNASEKARKEKIAQKEMLAQIEAWNREKEAALKDTEAST